MKLTYYAWIAEQIGVDSEEWVEPVTTIEKLIDALKKHGNAKEAIFSDVRKIYIAINDQLVPKDNLAALSLRANDVVSFFPAISGG